LSPTITTHLVWRLKHYVIGTILKNGSFKKTKQSFWKNIENQKKYMSWLENELEYKEPSHWYKVSQSTFVNNYGYGLLMQYQKSPIKIVQKFISGYDFITWKFKNVPKGYWSDKKNRKDYMEELGQNLGFEKPEDWYAVTYNTFLKNYGRTFVRYSTPLKAVSEKYPYYDFLPWLFKHVAPDFWNDMKNQKKYLVWLGKKHEYKNPDEATETEMKEWYNITQNAFYNNRGRGLLVHHYGGSPSLAVMEIFSNYNWEPEKFIRVSKNQERIFKIVEKLFSPSQVIKNYPHPDLRFKKSNYNMELDVFVPSLNLAIEYQGEQHFIPITPWGGEKALQDLQGRDQEKRKACKKNEIILIEIDYDKWDGSRDTVIEKIEQELKSKNRKE